MRHKLDKSDNKLHYYNFDVMLLHGAAILDFEIRSLQIGQKKNPTSMGFTVDMINGKWESQLPNKKGMRLRL